MIASICASYHSGDDGNTKEWQLEGIWAPSIRFFIYKLEPSWTSVGCKPLLTWPCPLCQPQSTGSPVLRVSASPLGLCRSPSCCITSCFCVFAHVSLTGRPLPFLTHLQLSLPRKLSLKTQFGCHTFLEVSPDLSYLPGWHLWKHFCYFLFTPLYGSLGPRLQLFEDQDCVFVAFVS